MEILQKKNLNENEGSKLFPNLIELCKDFNNIENLDKNYYLLKNYFEQKIDTDLETDDYKKGYEYIYLYFKQCNNDEVVIYYIYILRFFVKYLDKSDIIKLLDEINVKANQYINNKFLVSSLKSLSIYCNKYCNKYINTKNINKNIESILDTLIITNNIKRIYFYVNKIVVYLGKKYNSEINYDNILRIINNIDLLRLANKEKEIDGYDIESNNKMILFTLLKIINKCKLYTKITYSELENILLLVNKNIYSYIFFLNNINQNYNNKDNILKFISKIGYNSKKFEDIDNLNLKRGFITGIYKNEKNYLLKYQPNKSVMELIINCYLSNQSNKNYDNFLLPKYFFINNDNSYFYIIEKYKTDLHKYFNILESNNKLLLFKDIIYITRFILDSISILHKDNLIHSDFKLENIVLNIDEENNIKELKIIDFDVGLFNIVPKCLNNVSEKYNKILNNKKLRGTRIYMNNKNKDEMSFNNDIFSMGVISLILMYKNIKLFLSYSKKIINKKKIKNLIVCRNNIEENDTKFKMLKLIEDIINKNCIKKNNKMKHNINFEFLDKINDINKYKLYNQFIIDCINNKYNIEELKIEYKDLFY